MLVARQAVSINVGAEVSTHRRPKRELRRAAEVGLGQVEVQDHVALRFDSNGSTLALAPSCMKRRAPAEEYHRPVTAAHNGIVGDEVGQHHRQRTARQESREVEDLQWAQRGTVQRVVDPARPLLNSVRGGPPQPSQPQLATPDGRSGVAKPSRRLGVFASMTPDTITPASAFRDSRATEVSIAPRFEPTARRLTSVGYNIYMAPARRRAIGWR